MPARMEDRNGMCMGLQRMPVCGLFSFLYGNSCIYKYSTCTGMDSQQCIKPYGRHFDFLSVTTYPTIKTTVSNPTSLPQYLSKFHYSYLVCSSIMVRVP